MALSMGGLSGIIIFLITIHMGVALGYHVYMKKKKETEEERKTNTGEKEANEEEIKFIITEKMHGAFRWILNALIFLCWVFSISATSSCNFLAVKVPVDSSTKIEFGMGFASYYTPAAVASPAGCQSFDQDISGGMLQGNTVAFTFAIFNCLLTSLGLAGIVFIQFIIKNGRKGAWLGIQISMYISFWCCLFSFYLRQVLVCDSYDCSLGGAGVLQVFNVLFLICISLLLLVTDISDETALNKCRTHVYKE